MPKVSRYAPFVLSAAFLLSPISPATASDCGMDPVYERDTGGTITTGARVRDIACMEGSNVVTTLPVGTALTIIAETDGWYRIRTAAGLEGWVGQWLVSPGGDKPVSVTPSAPASPTVPLPSSGLVKSPSLPAVYLVSGGMRYAFPDDDVYDDWYEDFDDVKTVSAADLASLRLAGNVRHRPAMTLVKVKTDPKVYAISRYGVLRPIASESVAEAIFGGGWRGEIEDVEDTQFMDYLLGSPIASPSDYSLESESGQAEASDDLRPEGFSVEDDD